MKELNSTNKKLPRAQEVEKLFIERWNNINDCKMDFKDWSVRTDSGKFFSEYDVISVDKSLKIEIKEDITHQETGNFAIEYYSEKGYPTGISVTEADFWVTYLPQYDDFYVLEVNKLKELIKNIRYHGIARWCGDIDKPTSCYLFNTIRIFDIFPTKQENEQESNQPKYGYFLSTLTK